MLRKSGLLDINYLCSCAQTNRDEATHARICLNCGALGCANSKCANNYFNLSGSGSIRCQVCSTADNEHLSKFSVMTYVDRKAAEKDLTFQIKTPEMKNMLEEIIQLIQNP